MKTILNNRGGGHWGPNLCAGPIAVVSSLLIFSSSLSWHPSPPHGRYIPPSSMLSLCPSLLLFVFFPSSLSSSCRSLLLLAFALSSSSPSSLSPPLHSLLLLLAVSSSHCPPRLRSLLLVIVIVIVVLSCSSCSFSSLHFPSSSSPCPPLFLFLVVSFPSPSSPVISSSSVPFSPCCHCGPSWCLSFVILASVVCGPCRLWSWRLSFVVVRVCRS